MSIVDSYRVPEPTPPVEDTPSQGFGFQMLEHCLHDSPAKTELIDNLINIADLNAGGLDDGNVGTLENEQLGTTVPLTLGELRAFLSKHMSEVQSFRVETPDFAPSVTVVRWVGPGDWNKALTKTAALALQYANVREFTKEQKSLFHTRVLGYETFPWDKLT